MFVNSSIFAVQEMSVTVSRVESNWSPTYHRSLFQVINDVWSGIKKITGMTCDGSIASVPRPPLCILLGILIELRKLWEICTKLALSGLQ